MQNPFTPQPDAGSYTNLKEIVFQKIQTTGVNDQIFMTVQKAFEGVLAQENIILSRPERKRLLSQVLKMVLDDMIQKLEDRSGSAG